MIAKKRTMKPMEKLNLIPILDAIFIFIFFLLMSAQFVDIYEIGSDAPITSTIDKKQEDDKKPLNLTLKISKNFIEVQTGLDLNLIKRISLNDSDKAIKELQQVLIKLKDQNAKEKSIILKPSKDVPYFQLVKIIDNVKDFKAEQGSKKELFKQVIFETI